MNYTSKLLIAQPTGFSEYFERAVILICEHTAQGAWGLVLNKSAKPVTVKGISKAVGVEINVDREAYLGGPVETNSIHVVHSPDVKVHNTMQITPHVCVTSSVELMGMIGNNKGPEYWRLTCGMSCWSSGQLEGEMSGEKPWRPEHRWLTLDSPDHLLEINPMALWSECVKLTVADTTSKYFF